MKLKINDIVKLKNGNIYKVQKQNHIYSVLYEFDINTNEFTMNGYNGRITVFNSGKFLENENTEYDVVKVYTPKDYPEYYI